MVRLSVEFHQRPELFQLQSAGQSAQPPDLIAQHPGSLLTPQFRHDAAHERSGSYAIASVSNQFPARIFAQQYDGFLLQQSEQRSGWPAVPALEHDLELLPLRRGL